MDWGIYSSGEIIAVVGQQYVRVDCEVDSSTRQERGR